MSIQNYCTWSFRVGLPIGNGDFEARYVELPEITLLYIGLRSLGRPCDVGLQITFIPISTVQNSTKDGSGTYPQE